MGAKDWLIEKAGMAMLNQAVLKPYGALTDLKLVQEYELREENGRAFIVIKAVDSSREWLTTLLRNFAVDKPFELPDSVKKFLPMIR
jgi:hypothetical protein